MTKYHDNDPHNATEEAMFGTAEEHMADYYCDQAEAELKEQLKALQEEIYEDELIAEAELELDAHNFPEDSEDSHITPEMLAHGRRLNALNELRKETDDAIAEAIALVNAGHTPKHDHAPGQGDIFTCHACIINANR